MLYFSAGLVDRVRRVDLAQPFDSSTTPTEAPRTRAQFGPLASARVTVANRQDRVEECRTSMLARGRGRPRSFSNAFVVRVRRASIGDAAMLAEHRASVWHEVGGWRTDDLALQVPIWTEFFRDRIADATYVAFIAEEDQSAVGSGGLLIHVTIPRPGLRSDRAGRVQSVYVVPRARRTGIGRAIMQHLLAFAREANLVSLTLHPSDEARPLYAALGFVAADEMLLRFTPHGKS